MKKFVRSISIVLTAALILTLFPATVSAEETDNASLQTAANTADPQVIDEDALQAESMVGGEEKTPAKEIADDLEKNLTDQKQDNNIRSESEETEEPEEEANEENNNGASSKSGRGNEYRNNDTFDNSIPIRENSPGYYSYPSATISSDKTTYFLGDTVRLTMSGWNNGTYTIGVWYGSLSGQKVFGCTSSATTYDFVPTKTGKYTAYCTSYGGGLYADSNKITFVVKKPVKYKIRYKLNGGKNNSSNPTSYTVHSSTIKLKRPSRKGYIFEGWYADSNFETRVKTIETGSTGNRTLYAKWTAREYKITYDLNGGTNNSKNPQTYTITSSKIKLAKPKRKGYAFVGWYTGKKHKTKISSIKTGSTGNITLYAKWKLSKYKIVFKKNGGSGSMDSQTMKYSKSYKLRKNNFKRSGYYFAGWNTKADGSGKSYKDGQSVKNLRSRNGSKVTLYAMWKKGFKVSKTSIVYKDWQSYWKYNQIYSRSSGEIVSAESSDTSVATVKVDWDNGDVDASAWITPLKAGKTTITLTDSKGRIAIVKLTIKDSFFPSILSFAVTPCIYRYSNSLGIINHTPWYVDIVLKIGGYSYSFYVSRNGECNIYYNLGRSFSYNTPYTLTVYYGKYKSTQTYYVK